jgi:centromeric protein E
MEALPSDAAAAPSSENVSVTIRIRPLSSKERELGAQEVWQAVRGRPGMVQQVDPKDGPVPNTMFAFDNILTPEATTHDLFGLVGRRLALSAVEGFNGTIFAYGQTASGKTFTMQGSDKTPGILRLSIQEIFDAVRRVRR